MTISSYGFPDTIAPGGVWANLHRAAGRLFGFADPAAFRPTNTTTRAIDVQPGAFYAHGIYVSSNAAERVSLPNVVSGSQYFLVVADIRWNDDSGGYRTVLGYVAGTAARSIPSRVWSAGVRAQVPIALVRITAGASAPTEIVDLRGCQTVAGEYQIYDDLALNIYGYVGTVIYNVMTNVQRTRRGTSSFSTAWEVTSSPSSRPEEKLSGTSAILQSVVNLGGIGYLNLSNPENWANLTAIPLGDQNPFHPGRTSCRYMVELDYSLSMSNGTVSSTLAPMTSFGDPNSSNGGVGDVEVLRLAAGAQKYVPEARLISGSIVYHAVGGGSFQGGVHFDRAGRLYLHSIAPRTAVRTTATSSPPASWVLRGSLSWISKPVPL